MSATVQPTPAPWKPVAQASANFYTLLTGNKWLASIQFNGELMEAKQEANINLMAAAPDMANCIKKAIWLIERGEQNVTEQEWNDTLTEFHNVYKSATGVTA